MTTYQKFGLIMASNYPGTSFQLGGCIVDAERVRGFLVSQRGFAASNITTLYNQAMTKTAILSAFDAIVKRSYSIAETKQIPAFFIHYSGHGTRVWNSNTREFIARQAAPPVGYNDRDGDEAIVPQDVNRSGLLLDDEINTRLVQRLHPSTQLFVLTDCCNSGSNLDLAYEGLSKVESSGDVAPNIIHVAASRDSQLAGETNGGGAATVRFLQVMAKAPKTIPSLRTLMGDLSTTRNAQVPQVSVSKASLVQGELFPWMISNIVTAEVISLAPRVPAKIVSAPVIAISSQRMTMTISIPNDILRNFLPPK